MARVNIEELYRGENANLIIKHTHITAERIKTDGDFASEVTDAESLLLCEWERK